MPCLPRRPRGLLALLALYRQGVSQPLHFFPKSAWAYMRNGEDPAKAMGKWTGGNHPEFGEARDPAYRLALRGEAGLPDERFFALARDVLRPLLDHLDDPRLH